MTRCKFICTSVRKFQHWDRSKGFLYEASFNAVMGDSAENKAFFAASPSGKLEISTYREDMFEVGMGYYLELTPADLTPAPAAG